MKQSTNRANIMSNNIRTIFLRLFNIHPEEFRVVQTFFAYYTCIGMLIIVNTTVGDALFLSHVPQTQVRLFLPYVYVGTACLSIIVTWGYQRLLHRFTRMALLLGMQAFLSGSLLVFRFLLSFRLISENVGIYFGIMFWLRMTNLLVLMLFFSLTGDYFTIHAARRVYAYITGGMALGYVFGGLLIGPTVRMIAAENLLYVGSGLFIGGMGLSLAINRVGTPVNHPARVAAATHSAQVPLKQVLTSTYLQFLFLATVLKMVIFVIVDFQMKVLAKTVYPNSSELALFFGNFSFYVGLVTLLVQFLLVPWLLRHWGILTSLMILPVLYIGMGGLFVQRGWEGLAETAFSIIVATNFFRIILSDALDVPSREMLFLPLPPALRLRAQAILGGMVVPIGQGIGGILTLLLAANNIPLAFYSFGVIGLAFLWVTVLILERPHYHRTLAASLKQAHLETAELSDLANMPGNAMMLTVLLNTGKDDVISLVLDIFHDRAQGQLPDHIQQLVRHPNPLIAAKALALLGKEGDKTSVPVITDLLNAPAGEVREAAILAFCQIQGEFALQQIIKWIDAPDPVSQRAAIIGCGRYCGIAGQAQIRITLQRMAASRSPEERIRAANFLRDIGDAGLFGVAERLLDDPDMAVRRAAVEACGAFRSTALVPRLLRLMRIPELRAAVASAFADLPEVSVPVIVEGMRQAALDETSQMLLCRSLASIGGRSACTTVWQIFAGETPVILRVAAGQALQHMASLDKLHAIESDEMDACFHKICERIRLFTRASCEFARQAHLTGQLFQDQTRLEIECLFSLLACMYGVRRIENVQYNFFSATPTQRANALELLDDILPRRIAADVIPLLDAYLALPVFHSPERSESLFPQLVRQESYVRVITWHYVQNHHPRPGDKKFSMTLTESEETLYKLLDRIILLKKIPLFAEIAGNYLISLAQLAHPLTLERGTMLFAQGEPGDALYLICRGVISVMINGREVNQMGAGAYIGEMALLDDAPRSATCFAAEPTDVLCVSGRDFAGMLQSQPGMALVMLRTLSRLLRFRMQATLSAKERQNERQGETSPEGSPFNDGSVMPQRDRELRAMLETMAFLKRSALFHDLPENALLPLARMTLPIVAPQGAVIFQQDDPGDALYIVCRGMLSVSVNGQEVNQVGPGDYLGEMALLDGATRSATCIASETAELLRLTEQDFETIIHTHPEVVLAMLRTLAARLRQQTARSGV